MGIWYIKFPLDLKKFQMFSIFEMQNKLCFK